MANSTASTAFTASTGSTALTASTASTASTTSTAATRGKDRLTQRYLDCDQARLIAAESGDIVQTINAVRRARGEMLISAADIPRLMPLAADLLAMARDPFSPTPAHLVTFIGTVTPDTVQSFEDTQGVYEVYERRVEFDSHEQLASELEQFTTLFPATVPRLQATISAARKRSGPAAFYYIGVSISSTPMERATDDLFDGHRLVANLFKHLNRPVDVYRLNLPGVEISTYEYRDHPLQLEEHSLIALRWPHGANSAPGGYRHFYRTDLYPSLPLPPGTVLRSEAVRTHLVGMDGYYASKGRRIDPNALDIQTDMAMPVTHHGRVLWTSVAKDVTLEEFEYRHAELNYRGRLAGPGPRATVDALLHQHGTSFAATTVQRRNEILGPFTGLANSAADANPSADANSSVGANSSADNHPTADASFSAATNSSAALADTAKTPNPVVKTSNPGNPSKSRIPGNVSKPIRANALLGEKLLRDRVERVPRGVFINHVDPMTTVVSQAAKNSFVTDLLLHDCRWCGATVLGTTNVQHFCPLDAQRRAWEKLSSCTSTPFLWAHESSQRVKFFSSPSSKVASLDTLEILHRALGDASGYAPLVPPGYEDLIRLPRILATTGQDSRWTIECAIGAALGCSEGVEELEGVVWDEKLAKEVLQRADCTQSTWLVYGCPESDCFWARPYAQQSHECVHASGESIKATKTARRRRCVVSAIMTDFHDLPSALKCIFWSSYMLVNNRLGVPRELVTWGLKDTLPPTDWASRAAPD